MLALVKLEGSGTVQLRVAVMRRPPYPKGPAGRALYCVAVFTDLLQKLERQAQAVTSPCMRRRHSC
jgi:hypothetical protein